MIDDSSLVFELIAVGRSYFIQSLSSDSETKSWFDKIKLVCETKLTKGIEMGNLQVAFDRTNANFLVSGTVDSGKTM